MSRTPSGLAGSGMLTRRQHRALVARQLAEVHGGVVHRRLLRAEGVTRWDVRTEVDAGRWVTVGRHTVIVGSASPVGEGRWWSAVWEAGSNAVLSGSTALLAQGMTGFSDEVIHVSLPRPSRVTSRSGVLAHRHRVLDPVLGAGIPRTKPEWATIRAAQWAVSDRQAALLVCLAVQQRLVHPTRLLMAWSTIRRSPRRSFLDQVIRDVCDGAHSLGELDFARICRASGLAQPRRQVFRREANGSVYLDAEFDGGVVVEIDGSHHRLGLSPVDDALRANELAIGASRVLRIPLLGLRLEPERFLDQVTRALGFA